MDASLIFVPKMILEIAKDVSKIGPYINSLEAEMKKIGDLSLEIPCSILIFNKAIETLKKEANKMEWLDDAQLWPGRGISMLGENKMGCLYKPRPNRGGIFVSYKSWELYKDLSTSPLVNQIGKRSSSFGIFVKANEPKRANESSVCKKKKHRRCWSQELHRLFVDAIQQLGGAQVAKPKQIKEVMLVRGLTNAEIKSHLQKYRLHIQ